MRKDNRKPFVKREETEQHKINGRITASEIRLVVEEGEPRVMRTRIGFGRDLSKCKSSGL
jgi:hypothetical protein